MAKECDFLFVGPQGAGKTTIYERLLGNNIPEEYKATQNNDTVKRTGWFGWGLIGGPILADLGGIEQQINVYKDWLPLAKHVLFVFDGNEFIKELLNYQESGKISAMLKHDVFRKASKKILNISFIATHADEYEGNTSMKEEIIQGLNIANEEYKKIANADRYDFTSLFYGRLYCIDAIHDDVDFIKKLN